MFLLVGCGRELKKGTAQKKTIELNENKEALSVNTSDFSSFATTFSMFFIPEEKELTWESNLYKSTDSYQFKVARIMANIIKNSDKFDETDKKTMLMNNEKAPLTQKWEELECDFDPKDECIVIDNQLKEITAEHTKDTKLPDGTPVDFEGYKSFLIEEIQSSVDDYDRSRPELNRPKNWMLYGEAPTYEIRELENNLFQINFPNLGPFGAQNSYSTETGEIFDVTVTPSEYNPKIELLTFKIKEKGEGGAFTSLIWEFTLEKSFVVGKIRYKGDVLKVDTQGNVVRRGVCKIDMARKGS